MTDNCDEIKKSKSRAEVLLCIMSAVALSLTFIYSDVVISAMSDGMKLCTGTVIPSLFPFMVLSELFVASGAASALGKIIGKPLQKLFGISRDASAVWILGVLCGFPVGIRSALSLYERGRISRAELEHLCTFCNGPSSAFLVSAVGGKLFGSSRFGWVLYASHVFSGIIIGSCSKFYFEGKKVGKKKEYFALPTGAKKKSGGFSATFVDAVMSSAKNMLFICAFVVFFSAVIGFLRFSLSDTLIADEIKAAVFGFFEMTGGVFALSSLSKKAAVILAAAITGWSGMSVHFQLVGICRSHDFSLRPYFFAKAASACLNASITYIAVSLLEKFGQDLKISLGGEVSSLLFMTNSPFSVAVFAVFAFACFIMRKKIAGKYF